MLPWLLAPLVGLSPPTGGSMPIVIHLLIVWPGVWLPPLWTFAFRLKFHDMSRSAHAHSLIDGSEFAIPPASIVSLVIICAVHRTLLASVGCLSGRILYLESREATLGAGRRVRVTSISRGRVDLALVRGRYRLRCASQQHLFPLRFGGTALAVPGHRTRCVLFLAQNVPRRRPPR